MFLVRDYGHKIMSIVNKVYNRLYFVPQLAMFHSEISMLITIDVYISTLLYTACQKCWHTCSYLITITLCLTIFKFWEHLLPTWWNHTWNYIVTKILFVHKSKLFYIFFNSYTLLLILLTYIHTHTHSASLSFSSNS